MKRSQEPTNKIYDVLLFTTHHENDFSKGDPIGNKIYITDRLWIGKLTGNLGSSIISAHRPRGLRWKSVPQFGELYSFVYETRDMNNVKAWDEGDILLKTVALSRIAHPTTISFEYASRISETNSGRISQIAPILIYGSGTMAFVSEPSRNYLTEENALELKLLFEQYSGKPEEIARALWFYEYASRSYELLARWPLICSGLEALINTDSNRTARQFKVRIPILAKYIGVKGITRTKAEKMYDLRSKISHGQTTKSDKNKNLDLYDEMEEILRLAIKEGIRNPEFANIISNRELIDSTWRTC
jgi:hypothetical protein